MHYQPKARIDGGGVSGVEALVRWQHPLRGLLPPDSFLPMAQRYGLMRQITEAVLEEVLTQEAKWRADGIDLTVAVNLCGADLLDGDFPLEVAAVLDRHNTPRGRLQFEITENIVMAEPERVLNTLSQLGALGITFALDDYGTGYSSLAYLKRLPISELKIDRSFVWEMTEVDADSVIVRSTIELAHNLGVEVVAEGVETSRHWDLLSGFGCDTAQGYFLSKPLPADELVAWLGQPVGLRPAA
jgi:EAL domain-containing protein (putative c-di-GMP-specific phosphodiesterase class I)